MVDDMTMFSKILIANRGEIACRIIKTAKRLGVKTVAVYSDADKNALHVELADEAVHIGPSPVSESYLQQDAIIKAAQRTGAQAIHPGYGFLSENPEFVGAVEAAGLTFIGPSAKAISAMGLKDAAKQLMQNAGVPIVPGYHGADQTPELLKSEADKIGYPVLIKARAGGGGKGMRLVEQETDFFSALESAAREGQTAFGDPAVLIEKFITSPRHIEVQVFGDSKGNVVHMFERDCSLQRRHQKVIEEAPAPDMPDDVRQAMTQAAVKAAQAINYEGAGTIEFIADGSGTLRKDGFWFMEMNTRLQVEHPVTEAITGLDLVELQLRVAAGQALPISQDDIAINGHAFEARLYAEDVPAGFLPATGKISHLKLSPDARNDSGVRKGDVISPYYDPMIAKVITHRSNRGEALAALTTALSQTQVSGLASNISFLSRLSTHEGFLKGEVDTGLIQRNIDSLTAQDAPTEIMVAIAILLALDWQVSHAQSNWRMFGAASRVASIMYLNDKIERRLVVGEDVQSRDLAGELQSQFMIIEKRDDTIVFEHDGLRSRIDFARYTDGQECHVVLYKNAQSFEFVLPDPLAVEDNASVGENVITAPMSGVIRLIDIEANAQVTEGQRLVVLEAMKMEMNLTAPCAGLVKNITCQLGDAVEGGSVLIEIEPEA